MAARTIGIPKLTFNFYSEVADKRTMEKRAKGAGAPPMRVRRSR